MGWTLLRTNTAFRGLWLAYTGSVLGSWFNQIALALVTLRLTHSPAAMGFMLLARNAPMIMLGPFVGPLVDRKSKRRIMLLTDLVRAGVAGSFIIAIVFHSMGLVFIAATLLGTVSVFFAPARDAAVPQVVATDQLVVANAFSSQTGALAQILGAACGGILANANPILCFGLDALSYLWSAANIARTHWVEPMVNSKRSPYTRRLLEGLLEVRVNRIARAMIIIGISWGLAGGGYYVLVPVLAQNVYHMGAIGIGVLYVVDGIGVWMGAYGVSRWVGSQSRRAYIWYGLAYLTQAIFFGLMAQAKMLMVGAMFLLGMRISSGIIIPLDAGLLQLNVPRPFQGRVFALHDATYGSVMQLSYVVVGWAFQQFGYQRVGLIVGLVSGLCGVFWLSQRRYWSATNPIHRVS